MKYLRKKALSFALSAVMILLLLPTAFAEESSGIFIDKTATALKEDFTDVTLQIGADSTIVENKTISDVVFVLDKSTSVDVREEAAAMLEELLKRAGENKIQVGVIIFNRSTDCCLELTELNNDNYETIKNALLAEMSSGTNIEAGIRKGLEMLAADKEVADSAKHLVLVTDGVTYMWGAPPSTIYNEVNPDNISRIWASPSVCEFYPIGTDSKYIASFQNAAQWLSDQGEALSAVIDEKTCSYDDFDAESDPYLTLEKDRYTCCEAALYMTGLAWEEAASRYHCYAYASGKYEDTYPWAPAFIGSLDTIGGISGQIPADVSGMFDQVKSDVLKKILFSIEKGVVTDIIGEKFDLASLSSITMKKGGAVLSGKIDVESNRVIWGTNEEYSVSYYKSADGKEVLTWQINEPVEEPISLIYTLKLVQKENKAGTYTPPTNENAVLEYTGTDGSHGILEFPIPTVKYTIDEKGHTYDDDGDDEISKTTQENKDNPETGAKDLVNVSVLLMATSAAAVFFVRKHI